MPLNDAVIAFDLDGTLVDTAPDLISALNAVLEEERVPTVALDSARLLVGQGAKVLLERGYAAARRPWPSEHEDRLLARFIDVYRARITQESRPFAGVEAALDHLREAGARL